MAIQTKKMNEIAEFAQDLIRVHGIEEPPVFPEMLFQDEPVRIFDGDFENAFDGRLEYDASVRHFALFYNTYGRSKLFGRSRFSLSHETGHYFLDHHRRYLEGGGSPHSSFSGFVDNRLIEREADVFAANLLMPNYLVKPRNSDPDMKTIINLAKEFNTSLLCSAFRFMDTTPKSCFLVVSENNRVKYAIPSEDMASRAWLYIPKDILLPPNCFSSRVSRDSSDCEFGQIQEGESSSHIWNESKNNDYRLWEQAIYQRGYDRTVTLLIYESDQGEEDDDDLSE